MAIIDHDEARHAALHLVRLASAHGGVPGEDSPVAAAHFDPEEAGI